MRDLQPLVKDFNYKNAVTEYYRALMESHLRADVIDPWEMTITPLAGTFEGKFKMALPGKPFQAVRFERVAP